MPSSSPFDSSLLKSSHFLPASGTEAHRALFRPRRRPHQGQARSLASTRGGHRFHLLETECPQVCAARNQVTQNWRTALCEIAAKKNPAALEETQEPGCFSTSLALVQGAGTGRSFPTCRARAEAAGAGRGGAFLYQPSPRPSTAHGTLRTSLPPSNRPGGSAALNQGGGAETGPGLLANSRTRYRAGGGRLVRSGDQFLLALTPIPSPQGRAFIIAATLRLPRPPRAPFTHESFSIPTMRGCSPRRE